MANESVPIRDGQGNLRDIAVDTISGDDWQYTKVAFGDPDTATPVSATNPLPVSMDAAALAALENITVTVGSAVEINNDSGNAVPVSDGGASLTVDGTVELGATSLAALETTELGATTLAALETITVVDGGGSLTVDGTVELGAASLAALETVNVVDSALATAIGEVQASPTANTVLDRLKTIGLLLPSALASDRLKVEAVGNVASGASDSGNPVKVGGRYNATLPTLTDGQRGDLQLSPKGNLLASILAGSAIGDAQSAIFAAADQAGTARVLAVSPYLCTSTSSYDRQRNNNEATLLASAARTSTNTGADQTNYNERAAYIVIDITAGSGFGLTPAIQAKDSLSGKYYQLHANLTKLTGTGTYVYFFGLGTPAAAGGITAASGFPPPRLWRLVMTADDATSATYSAAVNYII